MVGIGGMTRLTNSGLSMVNWEPLAGVIPPITVNDWEEEFGHYKEYPEFKLFNQDMSLDEFKSIFFYEYLHRIFGRIIGLYFFLPFLYLSIKRKINYQESSKVLILLLLVGMQGLLGWYMVQSGLSENPNVSHIRLMLHLLAAMFLIVYTYFQYLRFSKKSNSEQFNISKGFSILIFILVLLQISYGALTAGLKAGYAYNTFPLMNGKVLPASFFSDSSFLDNMFYAPYTIQFFHRLLGIILFGISCYLIFLNLKRNNTTFFKSSEIQFSLLVLLQFLLGILTLILKVPLSIALAHQICACFVLILSSRIIYNQWIK